MHQKKEKNVGNSYGPSKKSRQNLAKSAKIRKNPPKSAKISQNTGGASRNANFPKNLPRVALVDHQQTIMEKKVFFVQNDPEIA